MEQYLLELIKNNNRVIVPNFGAFIVSRDAGTTVLFNNFLSFNDGLFINHVSDKEGIDTHEATQRVSDFVDKIKQKLDESGEYSIEKLGRFTKDKSGILRFTQDPHVSELLPDKKSEEKSKEEKDDTSLLDIDSETQEVSDKNKRPEQEPKKDKKSGPTVKDKTLLHLDEKDAKKEEPITNKDKKKQPSPKPKPPKNNSVPPKKSDDDNRKKSGLPPWLIALIIVIPLALILLYFFVWRDTDTEKDLSKEKTEIVDTIPEKPAIDSAAIKKAEEEERLRQEEEARKKEEAAKAKLPRHHIIVGSFKKESNAKKLISDLKSKGFENATSFSHNNLILVSATSFESVVKAREAQEEILQEQQLENWVLTKK